MYKYFLRLLFLNVYGLYAINVSKNDDNTEIFFPEQGIFNSPTSNEVTETQFITIKSYTDNKCEKNIETNVAKIGECKIFSKIVSGVFLSCNSSMVYGKIYNNTKCEGGEVAIFISAVEVCNNREIIKCSEYNDSSKAIIIFLYLCIPIIIIIFAYCYLKDKK